MSLKMAKAFDRLWHRALLVKLSFYELPEKWIASFRFTLFLLHIHEMLMDPNIYCYADFSTVDAVHSGFPGLSRENIDQCRNKLVSSVEDASKMLQKCLGNVSSRSKRNLV